MTFLLFVYVYAIEKNPSIDIDILYRFTDTSRALAEEVAALLTKIQNHSETHESMRVEYGVVANIEEMLHSLCSKYREIASSIDSRCFSDPDYQAGLDELGQAISDVSFNGNYYGIDRQLYHLKNQRYILSEHEHKFLHRMFPHIQHIHGPMDELYEEVVSGKLESSKYREITEAYFAEFRE